MLVAILLLKLLMCWPTVLAGCRSALCFPIFEGPSKVPGVFEWHPLLKGCLNFKLKAHFSAHIAFVTRKKEADVTYEVHIGHDCNRKTSILQSIKGQVISKVSIETPKILNGYSFRGFWICWGDSMVQLGKSTDISKPLLSLKNPDLGRKYLTHYGIRHKSNYTAVWIIEDAEKFTQRRVHKYDFHPLNSGALHVELLSKSNYSQIALRTEEKGDVDVTPYVLDISHVEKLTSKVSSNGVQKCFNVTSGKWKDGDYLNLDLQWHYGRVTVWHRGHIVAEVENKNATRGVSSFGLRILGKGVTNWRVFPIGWRVRESGKFWDKNYRRSVIPGFVTNSTTQNNMTHIQVRHPSDPKKLGDPGKHKVVTWNVTEIHHH